MRIHLLRHGSHGDLGLRLTGRGPEGGGRGPKGGLILRGWEEAGSAAITLARQGVTAVYASPRLRTQQTALSVAKACGVPVQTVDALDEIDFGDWTGRSFDDLRGDPAWDAWNTARASARPPNGEAMAAAVARAVGFLEQLEGEGPVACVSHCDVIRGVAAHYLGLSLDNLLRFEVSPASITTLDLWPDGGRVEGINRLPMHWSRYKSRTFRRAVTAASTSV